MKTFGSFTVAGKGPFQTWNSDLISLEKDVVKFWNAKPNGGSDLVAVANLEKGWTISEVGATGLDKDRH